ncbi:MAG: hypothetical protein WC551_13790 [Patescibacteria group bacterium]
MKRSGIYVPLPRLVRRGWAIQITRKDKTTFLAGTGSGTYPATWCYSNRRWAVRHKRTLRESGFRCRVVAVEYTDPVVIPPNNSITGGEAVP